VRLILLIPFHVWIVVDDLLNEFFSFFGFFSAAYLCTVSATRITTSCQHQLVSLIALQIQKIAVIILE
jgi:hypothetical protein